MVSKISRFKSLANLLRTVRVSSTCESNKQYFLLSVNPAFNARNRFCSYECTSETAEKKLAVHETSENPDLSDYGPLLLPSFSYAAYADHSSLLQEFIKLGVEIYKLEKMPDIREFILTLDFEKNVKPYLTFLHDNGVAAEAFGQFITKNPYIFKEDLKDLEVRINYLLSKKFPTEVIAEIITKNPYWLLVPVVKIDERLGYLQQEFQLKGDDVRNVIQKCPRLGTVAKRILMVNTFTLREQMDLDKFALKKVILQVPSLLVKNASDIISIYDYLTRTMMVGQELIVKQPFVLLHRKHILKERHQFLTSLGRAQYNPKLPGYISLLNLTSTNDTEFCEKVSKVPINLFNDFLKTL